MIIVADAHVAKGRGNHTDFFRMLDLLEKFDEDIFFLGDIFELWIAWERYEEDIHRRFLSWCKTQKQRRTIGYVEGNHEYYLAHRHRNCFSWVSAGSGRQDKSATLLVHGDMINRQDRNSLLFRKLAKNAATRNIVRILPFGPAFVHYLNRRLKTTNMQYRKYLPVDEIKVFADEAFGDGIDTIFIGHFHRKYEYKASETKILRCLPAWLRTGEVTVFDEHSKRIRHPHWQDLKTY